MEILTTCRKSHLTLTGKVCCVQHRHFIATESFSLALKSLFLEKLLFGAYKNEMSVLRSTNRPPRCRAYEIIRLGVIIFKKSTSTGEKLLEL